MKDFIKCTNCGFIGLVTMGTEICPNCKISGVLAWVDEKHQEVSNTIWFEVFESFEDTGTRTLETFDTIQEAKAYRDYLIDSGKYQKENVLIDIWENVNNPKRVADVTT